MEISQRSLPPYGLGSLALPFRFRKFVSHFFRSLQLLQSLRSLALFLSIIIQDFLHGGSLVLLLSISSTFLSVLIFFETVCFLRYTLDTPPLALFISMAGSPIDASSCNS